MSCQYSAISTTTNKMRFYNIISQVCVSKSTIRSVCIALFALPTGIFLANGIMLPTWIVRLGAGWAGPEVVTRGIMFINYNRMVK